MALLGQSSSAVKCRCLDEFFRGGSWYYRDGYRLPCLDRNSYEYRDKEEAIPYYKMLRNVVKNWLSSFSPEEQKELQQLLAEAETNRIRMKGTEKVFIKVHAGSLIMMT